MTIFKNHPDFSSRFFLSGEDKKSIRSFFTNDLIFFFESHPLYYIESKGDSILIRGKERLASIQEIKHLLAFAELATQFEMRLLKHFRPWLRSLLLLLRLPYYSPMATA